MSSENRNAVNSMNTQERVSISNDSTSDDIISAEHRIQPSASEAHDSSSAHKALVHSCLDKTLRVTLADGRTVQGTLDCFDNSGNMILSSASDITPRTIHEKSFHLGTVLIPGHVSRRILVRRASPAVDLDLSRSASAHLKFTDDKIDDAFEDNVNLRTNDKPDDNNTNSAHFG